jgi:isocitrate/isopropylmalate dehydrogenase
MAVDKSTVFLCTSKLLHDAHESVLPANVRFEVVNADAFTARQLRGAPVVPVVVVLSFVGDLLSDMLAAPVGWVGAVASASLAPSLVVLEPVYGSAPTRATEPPLQVNPLGAVRALGLLLEHVGETDAAAWVQVACDTLALHTPDRGAAPRPSRSDRP